MRFLSFICLASAFLFLQCTHTRDNPYDPGSPSYQTLLAPQGIIGQTISEKQIRLSWSRGNARTTGFVILKGVSATELSPYVFLNANLTSFLDTNCLPFTRYYYKIGAFDKLADTLFIPEPISIRTPYHTPADLPLNASLSAPANLNLSRNANHSVKITWFPANTLPIGYMLLKGTRPDSLNYHAQTAPQTLEYIDTLYQTGTTYYALCAFDTINRSNRIIDSITAMIAPESLSAVLLPANQIFVTWKGTLKTTDSILLEKQTTLSGVWNTLVKLPRGTLSYLDTNATSYSWHAYRVNAFSGTEKTGFSNTDSLFLPGIFPPLADTSTLICYHLDEDTGKTMTDFSSFHRNGSIINTEHLAGKFGKALYFSDTGFACTATPMDYPGTTISVEFWFKPKEKLSASSERSGFFQTRNGPITIYYYYGKLIAEFFDKANTKYTVFAECEFMPNQWYQIVVSMSGGKIKIFVDCTLKAWQSATFNTRLTSDTLWLGKALILGENRFYKGYMDEVRIRRVPEPWFK